MEKQKLILQIVAGIFFWPPMLFLGIKYGWQLPVLLFLILFSLLLQQNINKDK